MHKTQRLRPGTRVTYLDGSGEAFATPDVRIGVPWDGTYRVRQLNRTTGSDRIDHAMILDLHFVVAEQPS